MQMDIEIQSDIFGFIDARSVVVEIKLQQIKAINRSFYQDRKEKNSI